ncbi:MAG: eukaryotic-like serine/threonine-protein kinase [Chloroflexota bacterium]|nr:eukaryotic-like serine/threonine-protein kinase [Chloroflexota bacterium]
MTGTEGNELEGRLLAGRYRLVERIDRGGTAEVWRARDVRLDRDVAVKVLGAEADPAFRERFETEARRAAAVSHPHIVTVFDEGQDGNDAFIVMEEVRGRSLRDIVAERGALPAAEVATLVRQLGGALDATHRAGLVHLDVKPANVIVDDAGNAKLTDFGIARAARDSEERELVGTARYIAPERIEGRPVTSRTDVYGLALVAYELLTGRPAFPGAENEDLLRDRLERGAPHIRSADARLSETADLVVAKGLAGDPERRYPTAGAFALALSEAVNDPVTRVLRPIIATSMRRWPRVDSLLALGVVLAILVGVILFFARFPAAPIIGGSGSTATPAAAAKGTAPNVVGLDRDAAARALIAAGFHSPVPWEIDPTAKGKPCVVARQDPPAGSTFAPGTSAHLFITSGACGGKND